MSERTTFYLHPATRIHLDYGDELCREAGLYWSTNGHPADAWGFERGDFETLVKAKREAAERTAPGQIELAIGVRIVRRFDMNPRGDI